MSFPGIEEKILLWRLKIQIVTYCVICLFLVVNFLLWVKHLESKYSRLLFWFGGLIVISIIP